MVIVGEARSGNHRIVALCRAESMKGRSLTKIRNLICSGCARSGHTCPYAHERAKPDKDQEPDMFRIQSTHVQEVAIRALTLMKGRSLTKIRNLICSGSKHLSARSGYTCPYACDMLHTQQSDQAVSRVTEKSSKPSCKTSEHIQNI